MSTLSEHKTVQTRVVADAQEIDCRYVTRTEAEARQGFDPDDATPKDRARPVSFYLGDLPHPLMTVQIRLHHLDLSMLGVTGLGSEKPDQWESET